MSSVDIIETNMMFGVDIIVNVKVRKTTSYSSSEPEYKLAEVSGVIIPDEMDWDTKNNIMRNVSEEAFNKVKKYEIEIKGDKK